MSRLDLLTANDVSGQYPASQYAAGVKAKARPSLKGANKADVCIIGGGFTGLSAALTLAERGYQVVLLEAQRVGFGASGRNGGQIGTGQRIEVDALEKTEGKERAKALFALGVEAHDYVLKLCKKHKIDIGYQKGVAHFGFHARETDHAARIVERLEEDYDYTQAEAIAPDQVSEFVGSSVYHGGAVDWGSGHGDPLALALGLARAAEKAGAVIYENARVTQIEPQITTDHGHVDAPITLLACNGYLGQLHEPTARHVMPINNFIVATEPLGEAQARALIPQNTAIADTKFVINYYRLSPDHRLLFGGGESYGYRFPKDLAQKARKPMLEVFPALRDAKIDYAWGGTLAITMSRMPYIRRFGALYTAAGYSGHGVAMANYMGHLCALAIDGETQGFDLMASIKHQPFPGGTTMRHPLLVAAMLWFQLRDKIGI